VNKRALVLNVDGVLGTLFTPPDGSPKRPGVLLLGGSEGGAGPVVDAALLASHGYPALALSYFGQPGLPQTLRDIPMEYFATAAGLLAKEPSLDSRQVVTWGYSRGTEPAVLLAEFYPELVRGVILYAPTQRVNVGFPDLGTAWTRGNQPVPGGPLPVAHVAGPVLAIAGGADKVWLSGPAATDLKVALDAAHTNVRHEVLLYAAAGHGVGSFPYYPGPTRPVHPVLRRPILLGGSREANESARADGYPKMLTFLTGLAGKP
jgi:dienelactone hydrolase